MSAGLTENADLTDEQQQSFEKLLERVSSFFKRNKRYGAYTLIAIQIIIAFAALHQYWDFLKPKKEVATKEDLKRIEAKLIKTIQEKLVVEKEYRITNRTCWVHLKPKTKSIFLKILPKDFDVVILQINHKWAYVSFIDPTDNLSESGWVQKKYLNKPK